MSPCYHVSLRSHEEIVIPDGRLERTASECCTNPLTHPEMKSANDMGVQSSKGHKEGNCPHLLECLQRLTGILVYNVYDIYFKTGYQCMAPMWTASDLSTDISHMPFDI